VIGLNAVVGVSICIRQRVGKDVVDRGEQRLGLVGHHLHRPGMVGQGPIEEPPGRLGIAPPGHVHVDDLAVLVHGSVDVAPIGRRP
jgi:hypothetical protein